MCGTCVAKQRSHAVVNVQCEWLEWYGKFSVLQKHYRKENQNCKKYLWKWWFSSGTSRLKKEVRPQKMMQDTHNNGFKIFVREHLSVSVEIRNVTKRFYPKRIGKSSSIHLARSEPSSCWNILINFAFLESSYINQESVFPSE